MRSYVLALAATLAIAVNARCSDQNLLVSRPAQSGLGQVKQMQRPSKEDLGTTEKSEPRHNSGSVAERPGGSEGRRPLSIVTIDFKAKAQEFHQEQVGLTRSLAAVSRVDRQRIREEIKANRDDFKAAKEQFLEEVKEHTAKLKEQERRLREEQKEERPRNRE